MSWGIWAIVTVVLLILEMITVDFTFLMISGGALAATVVSAISGNLPVQIIIFAIVTVLLLFFIRPWARKHINNTSQGESNVYALNGKTATALSDITSAAGQVKVGGEVWSAKTIGEKIDDGTVVVITGIEGAQVIVEPKN